MENQENIEKEIALSDLSKSVTMSEFKAVLASAKSRYNTIKEIAESFEEARIKNKEKIEEFINKEGGEDKDFVESVAYKITLKIANGMISKLKSKMISEFGEEMRNFEGLVEFLNKFSTSEEKYELIDFTEILSKENSLG